MGQSAGAHLSAWLAVHRKNDIERALLLYPPTDVAYLLEPFQGLDSDKEAVVTEPFATGVIKSVMGVENLVDIDINDPAVIDNTFTEIVAQDPASFPPMFFLHGKADEVVPSSQSVRLCNALSGTPTGDFNIGPAENDGGNPSLGEYRKIYHCDDRGSQAHIFAQGDHILDVCVVVEGITVKCMSGNDTSAALAGESLSMAMDWLMNGPPAEFTDEQGRVIGDFDSSGQLHTYIYDTNATLIRERIHTLAPVKAIWQQPFDDSNSGFWSLPSPYMTIQNGQLVVTTQNTPNWEWIGAWGQRLHPFSDQVVFRAEVTTGPSTTGRYLVVGAESDSSLGAYRRHAAFFDEGNILASYYNGGWQTQWLGVAKNNTTYVVEVQTHGTGTNLYVFEKDQFRENGLSHSLSQTDWGNAQTFIEALGYPGAPATTMVIDNMSEAKGLGQVNSSYLLTESPNDTLIDHVPQIPPQKIWEQTFDDNANGLSPLVPPYMSLTPGRLVITSQADDWAWPSAWGDRLYSFSEGVVFRSEVTTGPSPSGRYLMIGAESDWGNYRRHAALFDEDGLYVAYYDNDWLSEWIGTIANNTTYIVEVDASANGTTLYIYEKGQPRDSGWSDHRYYTDWDGTQTFFEAQGYPGSPPGVMYIESVSEWKQLP